MNHGENRFANTMSRNDQNKSENDFQLRNRFQNVTTPPVCRPDKVV